VRKPQELARLAGETMTQAVHRAIGECFEPIRRTRNTEALAERLLKIGRECARVPKPTSRRLVLSCESSLAYETVASDQRPKAVCGARTAQHRCSDLHNQGLAS